MLNSSQNSKYDYYKKTRLISIVSKPIIVLVLVVDIVVVVFVKKKLCLKIF